MKILDRGPAWVVLLLLASCGGVDTRPDLSEPLKREIALNEKAGRAFSQGRYERAAELYLEALRISRSIENIDGTATNLLNLAVVYRAAGEGEKAMRAAGEILETTYVEYPPEKKAEASYVTALLALDGDDLEEADARALRSLSLCTGGRCPPLGRILNLRSRIALGRKEFRRSLSLASEALAVHRKEEAGKEEANSLRLMAASHKALKNHDAARGFYREALSIDKRLGLSGKIALDLMGLGDLEKSEGRDEAALHYFLRSLAVSEGAGDSQGAAAAAALIQEIRKSAR